MNGEKVFFRKRFFGGFNREDVVNYIAKIADERNNAIAEKEIAESNALALAEELTELRRERDELVDSFAIAGQTATVEVVVINPPDAIKEPVAAVDEIVAVEEPVVAVDEAVAAEEPVAAVDEAISAEETVAAEMSDFAEKEHLSARVKVKMRRKS